MLRKLKRTVSVQKSSKRSYEDVRKKMLFRKAKDAFFSFLLKNALSFSIIFLIVFANILIVSAEAIRMFEDTIRQSANILIGWSG